MIWIEIQSLIILGGNMNQQFSPTDVTSDDKLWALLAYILTPLVPVIILLMPDKSLSE